MSSIIPWRRIDPDLKIIFVTSWDTMLITTYHHKYIDIFLTVVRCTEAREVLAVYGTKNQHDIIYHHNQAFLFALELLHLSRGNDDW